MTCNPQGRYLYKCDDVKEIPWEKIGVFQVGPYSEEEVILTRNQIDGKVLQVGEFFLTCPNNVLREQ